MKIEHIHLNAFWAGNSSALEFLNWTFLTLYKSIGLQNSFFQFSFPEFRKIVTKIVKLRLLQLHLAIGFIKFFIKPNFIHRSDIRTYHNMPMEDAEHCSLQEQVSCGPMLLFIVIRSSTQSGCPINIKTAILGNSYVCPFP